MIAKHTNTEILKQMVVVAEDNGLEARYDDNLDFDWVLNGVWINGEYFENASQEQEYEEAREIQSVLDDDARSAYAYYNG